MKFKLTGRDFQSWKRFDLEVSGFTVIVGSSNRGKSALIRALRGVLRNQVQAAHIRKGEKTTEVSLQVNSDPVIKLVRNSSTTNYTVGEEAFSKLGGEVPDPVDDLRLGAISLGSGTLDPIFAGQFDSQFMMNLTPAELNSVFGMFSNTQPLNFGKKSVGQSNSEINSQAKLLANAIQDGHTRVAKMREIAEHFDKLYPAYTNSSEAINSAQTVKTLVTKYTGVTHNIERYRSGANLSIPSVESVEDMVMRGRTLRHLQKLRNRVSEMKQFSTEVPTERWERLTRSWTLLKRYQTVRQKVSDTKFIQVPPVSELSGLVQNQRSLHKLKQCRESITEKTKNIKNDQKDLQELHRQLHLIAKDQNACPNCGYQSTEE